MLRFPHLPEQIFQKLDNESLFKCREVQRSWQNIIDDRNYPWLRIVNIPTKLNGTIKNTYLHLAAKTGQIEAFKTAFNEEEDKNIKNGDGETPFHLACYSGCLEIVQLLLKNVDEAKDNPDIDLNAQTNFGITPFYYACMSGHFDVVKMLMENKAVLSIDIIPKGQGNIWIGNATACQACHRGQLNVVKIFIEYANTLNIDLKTKTKIKGDHKAFHWACEDGHYDSIKILMLNALLNANFSIELEQILSKSSSWFGTTKRTRSPYDLRRRTGLL